MNPSRCLALTGTLLFTMSAISAHAVVIHVPDDVSTIQEAVNAAADDDSILVTAGAYPECVTVDAKYVTIVGDGVDVTTVDAVCWRNPTPIGGVGGGVSGFTINDSLDVRGISDHFIASYVTVDGQTYVETLPPTVQDNSMATLSACTFLGDVRVDQGNWFSGATILNSEISGPTFYVDSEMSVQISGCVVTGSVVGIYGEHVTFASNTLSDCDFSLSDDSLAGTVRDNIVTGGSGLVIEGSSGAHVDVIDNVVTDATYGVHMTQDSTDMWVTGNRIGHCDTGVVFRGWSSAHAEGNVIWGCGRGIDIDHRDDGIPSTFMHNTITGCTNEALLWSAIGDVPWGTICANVITENGIGVSVQPSNLVDVLCNDAWSNTTADWIGIADPTSTDGNISVDPLFCQVQADNYTLADDSPCRPGNHPNGADCGFIGGEEGECVVVVAVGDPTPDGPAVVSLGVRPNPARDRVEFDIVPDTVSRRLNVFDVTGRRVATLPVSPGASIVRWDATEPSGARVPAGVYYAAIAGDGAATVVRLVVVR